MNNDEPELTKQTTPSPEGDSSSAVPDEKAKGEQVDRREAAKEGHRYVCGVST